MQIAGERQLELARQLRLSAARRTQSDKEYPLPLGIIHVEYHPRGVSRRQIRECFIKACLTDPFINIASIGRNNLKEVLKRFRFIVAYHRCPNVRDKLIRAAMWEEPERPVSFFVQKLRESPD